jgi:hypothetical protein
MADEVVPLPGPGADLVVQVAARRGGVPSSRSFVSGPPPTALSSEPEAASPAACSPPTTPKMSPHCGPPPNNRNSPPVLVVVDPSASPNSQDRRGRPCRKGDGQPSTPVCLDAHGTDNLRNQCTLLLSNVGWHVRGSCCPARPVSRTRLPGSASDQTRLCWRRCGAVMMLEAAQ